MDLTTWAAAVLIVFGLLATDAVLHSGSVVVEVAAPADIFAKVIDQHSLEDEFTAHIDHIASSSSVLIPPEIRASDDDDGIGMVVAESVNLKTLAFALQRQIGLGPDHLRFALFTEDSWLHGEVSGTGHTRGTFRREFIRDKDEKLLTFIQRCASWGAAQLAPYSTALFMLQHQPSHGDFRDAETLARQTVAALPAAAISQERAQFENLLGLVDVFRNDPGAGQKHFQLAAEAWPDSPVPVINLAFADLQLDDYAAAAARTRTLLASMSTRNKPVAGTAHLTLAAALLGQHDLDGADAELAQALNINPDNSTAAELWSALKMARGDAAGADRLNHLAQRTTSSFETLGEMAVLYFHLYWTDNLLVMRSRFGNPEIVTAH